MSQRVWSLSWWDRFLWGLRRWRNFPMPDGERLDGLPKVRDHVAGMLEDIDWGVMASQRITGSAVPLRPDGVGTGTPMQRGRVQTRPLTWGLWDRTATRIPLPVAGGYWIKGWPTPSFDERVIITGSDQREVVEMIQFKPDQGVLPVGFAQQAMKFGRFFDGKLVEGKATTATRLPLHPYVWDRLSAEGRSHVQALVLADYVGADGLLSKGPRAGDRVALDPKSLSYRRMIQAGGECAARAIALVVYGAVIIDRSGYADSPPDRIGTKPHPPSLHTQAGAWIASTNLPGFDVALADLRRVVG